MTAAATFDETDATPDLHAGVLRAVVVLTNDEQRQLRGLERQHEKLAQTRRELSALRVLEAKLRRLMP